MYGGTAGEPYDPCYHEACDTINNISSKAIDQLGDAAAHAVYTIAFSRTSLFGDSALKARTFSSLSSGAQGGNVQGGNAQGKAPARKSFTAEQLSNPALAGAVK